MWNQPIRFHFSVFFFLHVRGDSREEQHNFQPKYQGKAKNDLKVFVDRNEMNTQHITEQQSDWMSKDLFVRQKNVHEISPQSLAGQFWTSNVVCVWDKLGL